MNDSHLVLPLVTLGDPSRLSGGYLYHLRMAAAPAHGARIRFLSFPRPFPLAAIRGAAVFRRSKALERTRSFSTRSPLHSPVRLAMRSQGVPVIAVLHQPPGIDHGPVRTRAQAPLDRLALRRASLLIAASDHLAEQLLDAGFTRSRIRVVPPDGRRCASTRSRSRPPSRASGRVPHGRQLAAPERNWSPRGVRASSARSRDAPPRRRQAATLATRRACGLA